MAPRRNYHKVLSLLAVGTLSFFFFTTAIALAAEGSAPLAAPGINTTNPVDTIISTYKFATYAAGGLAFVMIVIASIRYALSLGNPSAAKDAIDQIGQALLGILLLFGAYIILQTINPGLTDLKLPTLAPVNTSVQQATGTTGGSGGGGGGGGGGEGAHGGSTRCTNCNNSPAVQAVLNCVRRKSEGSFTLGSIYTYGGRHSPWSCHFGGRNCVDGAHAIDFGNEAAHGAIFAAVRECAAETGRGQECFCENSAGNRFNCDNPAVNHIHCNIDTAACGCD